MLGWDGVGPLPSPHWTPPNLKRERMRYRFFATATQSNKMGRTQDSNSNFNAFRHTMLVVILFVAGNLHQPPTSQDMKTVPSKMGVYVGFHTAHHHCATLLVTAVILPAMRWFNRKPLTPELTNLVTDVTVGIWFSVVAHYHEKMCTMDKL